MMQLRLEPDTEGTRVITETQAEAEAAVINSL